MEFPRARHVLDRFPGLTAAGLLAAALVLAVSLNGPLHKPAPAPPARHPHAVIHKKPPAPKNLIATTKPKPPKGPSVFALESAMTPKQLMARWDPLIAKASKRFVISEAWIRAVMRMESGGRTMIGEGKPITSTAGAMGIMQMMPATYSTMRLLYGLGKDPYDPTDNVMAGAAYLRILFKAYGYPSMFAAYNDGPAMLEAHDRGTHPWPAETVNYVAGITAILSGGSPGRAGGASVRLTRPDGTAVMIDAAAVMSVRAALPGEYAPGVQAVISIQRMRQGVRESVAAATAIIRAHGGRI